MKAVFVGGGAHRLVAILRSALAHPGIFEDGEIYLLDLNVPRAEAVGRVVQQCPEFKHRHVKIRWGSSLDEALPGADLVGVILMAGSRQTYTLGEVISPGYGFISSDNVSPNGDFLAIKGAPILLNVARKMEQHCPAAWLLDFANPIAVLSAMVNRHTRIKALGVCAGFTNHFSDLNRLIYGKDAQDFSFDVRAAGVNHLSFITDGFHHGKDIFEELDRALAKDWKAPELRADRSEGLRANITRSVNSLARFYRELGVLIFSTEGDGMDHLRYDEAVAELAKAGIPSRAEIAAKIAAEDAGRRETNRKFEAQAKETLDDAFWAGQPPHSVFAPATDDIFLRILRGVAGVEPVNIVSSRLNDGAIEGLPNDLAVEYSQVLFKDKIRAAGRFKIPSVVHGLISGLAAHQTMLGDACATGDPKLLAQALLAYPVHAYTKQARGLYRELIAINREEIPASLRTADVFLT